MNHKEQRDQIYSSLKLEYMNSLFKYFNMIISLFILFLFLSLLIFYTKPLHKSIFKNIWFCKMSRSTEISSTSRMRQILKISWAWNYPFLMLSGSLNKLGPFWLIEAPETDIFSWFQGPEIVKKALLYIRGLKWSKWCNFRLRKGSKRSRDPLWFHWWFPPYGQC